MKEKDFIKHYRNLVGQGGEEAPGHSASASESSSDMNACSDQKDLDMVWEGISDQLDIDQVWDGISHQLDKDRKKILFLRITSVAAAAVLLLVGLFFVFESPFFPSKDSAFLANNIPEVMPQVNVGMDDDSVQHEHLPQADVHPEVAQPGFADSVFAFPLGKDVEMAAVVNLPKSQAMEQLTGACANLETDLQSVEFQPDLLMQIKASEDLMMAMEMAIPLKDIPFSDVKKADKTPVYSLSDNMESSKRWTLGAVSALKNAYLLNRETMNGFGSSGMNRSHVGLNYDFGLELGYALNNRWQVAATVFLNSPVEQRYDQYMYGQYTSKVIDLNYLSSEIVVKHKARRGFILQNHLQRKNVAGVYAANLKRASQAILDKKEDVTDRFEFLDYGLVLGQEFETRFKGSVNFTAGLRLKMGIPNIYKGDDLNPSRFNQTRNAALEFRVGMLFQWGKLYGPVNNSIAYVPVSFE